MTISENVLDKYVQATFEYYKSICAHDEYKMVYGKERLETKRRCQSIVAECLKEYDKRYTTEKKQTLWSWYPWYHKCATNSRV